MEGKGNPHFCTTSQSCCSRKSIVFFVSMKSLKRGWWVWSFWTAFGVEYDALAEMEMDYAHLLVAVELTMHDYNS